MDRIEMLRAQVSAADAERYEARKAWNGHRCDGSPASRATKREIGERLDLANDRRDDAWRTLEAFGFVA